MQNSLRDILKRHVKSNDPECVPYIKDFLLAEEYSCEYIANVTGKEKEDLDVLSCSPEQIASDAIAKKTLDDLVHAYIKLLPFSERLDAITEFNHLFAKNHLTDGYHLYTLRRFKDGKSVGRQHYCRTEDLLDGVEVEILLLKRLQKGELELMLNPDGDVDTGRASNTQDRLANEFCMSRSAIMKHIEKLKYTHNLLGFDLNIPLNESTREYGGTTIHPVFLALNPTEVVLLTVWLKKTFPETDGRLGEHAAMLADDIFRQLSNHGKSIVRERAKELDIVFDESTSPRESVPQHRLENYKNDIGICTKRNTVHCKIKIKTDLGVEEREGYLSSRDGFTYELRNEHGVAIETEPNGDIKKIKEKDIVFFNVI